MFECFFRFDRGKMWQTSIWSSFHRPNRWKCWKKSLNHPRRSEYWRNWGFRILEWFSLICGSRAIDFSAAITPLLTQTCQCVNFLIKWRDSRAPLPSQIRPCEVFFDFGGVKKKTTEAVSVITEDEFKNVFSTEIKDRTSVIVLWNTFQSVFLFKC